MHRCNCKSIICFQNCYKYQYHNNNININALIIEEEYKIVKKILNNIENI